MRKSILAVTVILISGLIFGSALASDPDTIMSRHIRALGGRGTIKALKDFQIEGSADYYGIPSKVTIRGIYSDYFEVIISNDTFEVVQMRSPEGDFIKTADGSVIKPMGLDMAALFALSSIFNYAYIVDMSLPLIPETEEDPRVFTMDTGSNFGTVIVFDAETYLIERIEMETGSGKLTVSFSDYEKMSGIQFPKSLLFSGATEMNLTIESFVTNEGLTSADFPPPSKGPGIVSPIDTGTVPLKMKDGLITFDVKIGGGIAVLLDSAWGDLPVIGGEPDDPAGGEHFACRICLRGRSTIINALVEKNREVKIKELSISSPLIYTTEMEAITGFDAIFGYTLFARAPVGIAINRGEMTIYSDLDFTPPDGAKKVRLTIDGGRPLIDGVIDGEFGSLIIDTGYPGFGYVIRPVSDMPEGTEDTGENEKYTTSSINAGGVVFEGVELELIESPLSYPSSVIGALGVGFIEDFDEVIFDYQEGILYLVPGETDTPAQ